MCDRCARPARHRCGDQMNLDCNTGLLALFPFSLTLLLLEPVYSYSSCLNNEKPDGKAAEWGRTGHC